MPSTIFVNYRQQTDYDAARGIVEFLKGRFGQEAVFFDRDSIEGGEDWGDRLQERVQQSIVLLAIIGPQWLAVEDEFQKRRIDIEGDWVRREIAVALERCTAVIPVLVDGAELPSPNELPLELAKLVKRQAVKIRRDSWHSDAENLSHAIQRALREGGHAQVLYPGGYPIRPVPLSPDQIANALAELPYWQLQHRPITDDSRVPRDYQGTELVRYFKFKTFLDAIEFMRQTAATIDAMDHHPKWENIYWNLIVRLTTFDILHQLSDRDIKLARFLESSFRDFPGAD